MTDRRLPRLTVPGVLGAALCAGALLAGAPGAPVETAAAAPRDVFTHGWTTSGALVVVVQTPRPGRLVTRLAARGRVLGACRRATTAGFAMCRITPRRTAARRAVLTAAFVPRAGGRPARVRAVVVLPRR